MATDQPERLPDISGWTGAPASMTPEEWEAMAIQFRAELGLVPYNVWKNLPAESKEWVGGLVQKRARHIISNLDTVTPGILTAASTTDLVLDERVTLRNTAYLLRVLDALRRGILSTSRADILVPE